MRSRAHQERVRALFHGALDCPREERGAFLVAHDAGDESVRHEVESLLAAHDAAEGFLERPVSDPTSDEPALESAPRLALGSRLGAFEILDLLGAGGMGEVYRARDTRLGRDVAIKILPSIFTADHERRTRFAREARLLATLNHPHIGAIHGLEEADGLTALVLELVEGPTLAERLSRGPLPFTDTLAIARQITDALEAAHEKGIVHRDLKPANIVLQRATNGSGVPLGDVRAKVLDFGLAKTIAAGRDGDRPQPLSDSLDGTADGRILGTPAYMSPEQARGHPVDKRTDVWAFGCVLYEMLTGRRAFGGDAASDVVAAVMTTDPDWSRLPPATPAGIRRVLKRCLEKSVTQRLQAIGDARIEIEDALAGRETDGPRAIAAPAASWIRRPVPLTLALVLGLATIVAGTLAANLLISRFGERTNQVAPEVTRTLINVAPADRLQANGGTESLGEGRPSRTAVALSPNGRSLVFSAVRGNALQLYVRKLDELAATPIPGTDGGASPFFAPDGQWVGFWAQGKLKKVALTGAAGATTIVETGPIYGASWGSNNTIVFARTAEGLWQVPATGGTPRPLTELDARKSEVSHRLPQLLPGNQAVLFTVTRSHFPIWEEAEVVVQSVLTGERKELVQGADARYVPSGHLVYVRAGALLAVPFDLGRLQVTGGPVSMIPDVMQAAYAPNANNDSGAGQFAVSASGGLVYVPGGMFPELERSLLWVDRTGATQLLTATIRAYYAPRLSPDGQKVLVWTSGRDRNVWLFNIPRGTLTPLTREGRNAYSQWTPDGSRVTFNSENRLQWKSADGAGPAERPTAADYSGFPSSWSPDGKTLAFVGFGSTYDIWALALSGDRQAHAVVETKFAETHPEFSPDGRWLAYTSNESGRVEVYVQPYPGPGPRHQVSVDGGFAPAWSRHSRELFYQMRSPGTDEWTERRKFMAVTVTTGQRFDAGIPRVLFELPYPKTALPIREYDVTPDGRRFLVVQDSGRPPIKVTTMILVQNWVDELKRKVPTK